MEILLVIDISSLTPAQIYIVRLIAI